jgi:hypothetical protein
MRQREKFMESDWAWTDFIPFVVAILVAIGSLFMIDAGAGFLYGLGMALFAVTFLFGLWSINRYFNRWEARRRQWHGQHGHQQHGH